MTETDFYIVMRNGDPGEPRVEAMLDALAQLVEINTCFPPGACYREITDLCAALCAPLGGSGETVEVPEALWQAPGASGPRVNLIQRPDLGPVDAPEALIYFHIDTAPVGNGWTRPPLSLTREDTRVYGRGTADMKGTIVAVLDALIRMKRCRGGPSPSARCWPSAPTRRGAAIPASAIWPRPAPCPASCST